jgi:hypothetical protein
VLTPYLFSGRLNVVLSSSTRGTRLERGTVGRGTEASIIIKQDEWTGCGCGGVGSGGIYCKDDEEIKQRQHLPVSLASFNDLICAVNSRS